MSHGMEDHPIAACWPLMSNSEIQTLGQSIKHNGLIFPIIVHQGKILDGRNRYRACTANGITPRFEDFTGSDPVQYARDVNESRRHETPTERALIAAKLANVMNGSNQFVKKEGPAIAGPSLTVEKAALIMDVPLGQVEKAKRILRDGSPQVIKAVEEGEMTINAAVEEIKESKADRAQPTTASRIKIVIDQAEEHWVRAHFHLEKIIPQDIGRREIMQKALRYIQSRIGKDK